MGDRLAEIKERLAGADSGPWSVELLVTGLAVEALGDGPEPDGPDALFVSRSREDIEWLVDQLEVLRSALRDLEDLAGAVASGAAATAELARMVRTNQIRAEVPQ
jgi:hypothetical protein